MMSKKSTLTILSNDYQMLELNKQLAAAKTNHEQNIIQRQIDATDHHPPERHCRAGIDHLNILNQLTLLEKASDVKFNLSDENLSSLKEMSLVRNLGLHNRWEVDKQYQEKNNSNDWEIGEIRVFDPIELYDWHESLIEAVNMTCVEIAKKFNQAPDFLEINS